MSVSVQKKALDALSRALKPLTGEKPVTEEQQGAALKKAVAACSTSLRFNPGDRFATENLQLARRALFFAGDRTR